MATPDITGGFDCEESPKTKAVEEKLQKLVHKAFASAGPTGRKMKNFLNGTWIGHPLHVILTDVPIGAWTTALVFDALELVSGRDDFATTADNSVAIGIAGALGAALTGVTDWQDADAPARRLGMIHGILNLSGTALFAASLISRKRKSRTLGRILGVLGYGVMTTAARLGGKMVYEHRVGVDRTASQTFPADFVSVLAESELAESEPKRAEHERFVQALCEIEPVVAEVRSLARRFLGLMHRRKLREFDRWLTRLSKCAAPEMQSFAASLRADLSAVRAAFSSPWSNGPTEGHINRLKLLKRQMYGRASVELLRLRVLSPN